MLTLASIDWTDELLTGTAGGDDEWCRLTLYPLVTPAQMQAMPSGSEAGESQLLSHDIRFTYADGLIELVSTGTIALAFGVTTV